MFKVHVHELAIEAHIPGGFNYLFRLNLYCYEMNCLNFPPNSIIHWAHNQYGY